MVNHKLYMNEGKRDEAYRTLVNGGNRYVRRGTVTNQELHPMYVEDFEGPEKEQTGLGNTVYRTFFSELYTLDY
jgi:hypothetical protein